MASGKRNIQSQLVEVIQCAICLDTPVCPKLLQCQHTFCLSCLQTTHTEELRKGVITGDKIRCPICRISTDIPTGGLEKLPNDLKAQQLVEIVKNLSLKDGERDITYQGSLIKSLPEHLHQLMETSFDDAQMFLSTLSKDDRITVVNHKVGGYSALAHTLVTDGKSDEQKLSFIEYLIQQGSQVNCKFANQDREYTPIYWACVKNKLNIMKVLIKAGANVNVTIREGNWTAGHAASALGYLDVLECLSNAEADLSWQDLSGYTCFIMAAQNNHVQIGTYLLSKGVNINHTDHTSNTALNWAADLGQLDFLQMLLANGADVTIKDGEGDTALSWAVQGGCLPAVKCLLDYGSDPYVRNNKSEDSFLMASVHNKIDILKFLVSWHMDNHDYD